MTASTDTSESAVYKAVGDFVAGLLPTGIPIVQSRVGRVPTPNQGYILMTATGRRRLDTDLHTYGATSTTLQASWEYRIKLDFFAANGSAYVPSDWADIVATVFRSDLAPTLFASNVQPLYEQGPYTMDYVSDANIWERMYSLELLVQYDPTITISTDSFTSVNIKHIPADVVYTP